MIDRTYTRGIMGRHNARRGHANRLRVLEVPVFGQRDAECGNTSLKSVAWFHGRRFTAKHLGELVGVTEEGVDHDLLVQGAVATGATVFAKAGGTITELRRFVAAGMPVIVGWWSMDEDDAHFESTWSLAERKQRDCGHFSVVCGVTDRDVVLMDPQWAVIRGRLRVVGRRRIPIDEFLAVWYDTDTDAYEKVERWYMVVNYEGRHFAGSVPGGHDHA